MDDETGYLPFVKIARDESGDFIELPSEKDGCVLLSTMQSQFPSAIGLKYKSSVGSWRGIRSADGKFDPPFGGWGDGIYVITESDTLKRKTCEHASGNERKSRKSSKLLEDLIVLGLPFVTSEEDFNAYFTDMCGELAYCELKRDRETKKSRGFGFIRFKTEEAAQEALKGHHEILGRKLEIRLSRKKDDVPMKLFVGRLASGTTQEEVNEYFSEFGEIIDIFVPESPFRGFGFVTFSSQEDAMKVSRMNHMLNGARLNVTAAEAKEDKGAGKPGNNYNGNNSRSSPFVHNNQGNSPFGQNAGRANVFGRNNLDNSSFGEDAGRNTSYGQNTGYDPRSVQQASECPQGDVASQLKDMLITLINNQK